MKNVLMMLSVIATTMVFSCGLKEEKPTEVIVIEKEVEKEPAPAQEKEGTSIEVDKNVVKISTDKTSVDLKHGKAKVEVKD